MLGGACQPTCNPSAWKEEVGIPGIVLVSSGLGLWDLASVNKMEWEKLLTWTSSLHTWVHVHVDAPEHTLWTHTTHNTHKKILFKHRPARWLRRCCKHLPYKHDNLHPAEEGKDWLLNVVLRPLTSTVHHGTYVRTHSNNKSTNKNFKLSH